MVSYRQSGVDIDAADDLVDSIKRLADTTNRRGAFGGIGGFGALFDPRLAGYKNPILVTSTDGVGTKLKIAIETGIHDTIGIDLVAMCVNDIITQGAEPLAFLDYFATGKLDINTVKKVVAGITKGCAMAGCVLAGGETAEMPGMYADGHYDLAGFCLGAVKRNRLLPKRCKPNDLLIGLSSSGVHANGYSLVNLLMQKHAWDDVSPFEGKTFAEEFLTPTTIYVNTVLRLNKKRLIRGAAHITGGGWLGNIPRMLPNGLGAKIVVKWTMPKVFQWLQKEGDITRAEMFRTFNCGIGMVLAVPQKHTDEVCRIAKKHDPRFLGVVEADQQGVRFDRK